MCIMESRRHFLQKITATAFAAPLVPAARNVASHGKPYQGRVLRVAIMGLGNYGTRVAEAMRDCKRAKLVGLVSRTPSKAAAWRRKYQIPEKNCYTYDNFDEMKDNPDIDAVYIITPNALHKEEAIRVARAGKHVICEKPMSVTVADGQAMVDACKKANVKLLIGYRMHLEPNTLDIIRMRNEGTFGKIMFFQGLSGFRIGDPNQWRLNKALSGGGAMMDIGIYSVNGARYMVGEEPVWVTAQETKNNPEKFGEGIDETIQFQFGFPGGAVASCLSTYSMNYLDRFYLNGEKGFAELNPATGYGPIKGRTHLGELNHPHVAHQTIQMEEMAGMILEGRKPPIPMDGEEALKDLRIIEAIYKAAKEGKKIHLA